MEAIIITNSHQYTFWGQTSAITISSPARTDPYIFLQCIKKKPDGAWEKPTKKEGLVVRMSLEEIIMILQVLNRKLRNWTTYHSYKEAKTQISIQWEDDNQKTLWINIANYSKMLNFSQGLLLKNLLVHILNEKIQYATSSRGKKKTEQKIDKGIVVEELDSKKEPEFTKKNSKINGKIQGETEKAFLIIFETGQEVWIPKSKIASEYVAEKDTEQEFLIENWLLKKNGLI